jgi:hypothetical protein
MEHFEKQVISSTAKKPTRWYRYVDDTFVVWPHGKDELQRFLKHLNSIHSRWKLNNRALYRFWTYW